MKLGSFDSILDVLQDERMTEYATILERIASEVVRNFMNAAVKRGDIVYVKTFLKFLLDYTGHRLDRVRKYVSRKVKQILDVFPQFLWDREIVERILTILEALSSDQETSKPFSWEFVNGEEKMAKADVTALISAWFSKLVQISPPETISLIQSFLLKSSVKRLQTGFLSALFERLGTENGTICSLLLPLIIH